MEIASEIVCIDCGGRCGLLTPEPPGGFRPGDVVAYRCAGCVDRWDLQVDAADRGQISAGPMGSLPRRGS